LRGNIRKEEGENKGKHQDEGCLVRNCTDIYLSPTINIIHLCKSGLVVEIGEVKGLRKTVVFINSSIH